VSCEIFISYDFEVLYMNDRRVNTTGLKSPSYFRRLSYDNLKNFHDAIHVGDRRGGVHR
jgi:hypothetical protein